MTDAAKIARGLTKAQRYLLELAASSEHACTLDRDVYDEPIIQCLKPIPHHQQGVGAFRITPLGLAVRAELERIADE